MLLTILLIFFASLLSPFFYKRYQLAFATLLSLLLLGIIAFYATHLPQVSQGESFVSSFSWIDSLNIHLTFYLDGLSLFFTMLITVMGLLVLLYSFKYMEDYPNRGVFFSYLLLFMGAMLGLVLSANLISLFVFWELTSFSSFLLIGFKNQKAESRRAARQALLVTAGGGLALMSGFILLEVITTSDFDLLSTLSSAELVQGSNLHVAAVILISTGAISKSAQFPLHFWLPNAMAAPTPVSAYLHSATMVKAGVYLIFRLNPLFEDIALWSYVLGITGAVTMTWGAFKALQQDDIKKILAYTTISALGIFFMMTGIGGENAINAVMVYVLAHALYKGGLFLLAGNIEHQTGSRKLSELSDLVRKMPYTATAVIFACASMAGVIPFIGFVGKELLYEALYHSSSKLDIAYLVMLFLAGAFFTAATLKIVYGAFLKKGKLQDKAIKEAGVLMVFSPLFLGIVGLFTGIVPQFTVEPLLKWAAAAVYQTEFPTQLSTDTSMKLKLWHGFNIVLLLSLLTLLFGVGIYAIRKSIKKLNKPFWLNADFIYDKFIRGTSDFSKAVTNVVQNGYLRNYIAVFVVTFSGMMIYVFIDGGFIASVDVENLFESAQIYELVIIALVTLATAFLFKTKSRLIVTATFGIIGYSIALAYTLFSAPDVAITQFLAETLSLILLILILHRLPPYTLKKNIAHKKYLPLALLFGVIMAFTSFTLLNREVNADLKTFFLENSLSEGKGKNAVNVILTDFRALDTLGEITVLTVTMIGIIALLKIKSKP